MAKWDPDIVLDQALVRRLITGQSFEPHTLRHFGTGWAELLEGRELGDLGEDAVAREALGSLRRAATG